jgi:hypothetical protein
MPVAALVLGILGLVLFSWLGPAIGFTVAGVMTASSGQLVTWPLWLIGGIVGGLFPLSAVFVGLGGLKQEDSKGICVAGMVLGGVAALLGLGITAGVVVLGYVGEEVLDRVQESGSLSEPGKPDSDFNNVIKQINDPEFQKRLQEQLESARGVPPASPGLPVPSKLPAEAPTAPPTPPPAQ